MSNKILSYIFLLLLLATSAKGQTDRQAFEADIVKITQAYEQNTRLSMDVCYKLFPSYTSKELIESIPGKMMRDGKLLYREQMNNLTIQNEYFLLGIDHKHKSIIVKNPLLTSQDENFPVQDIIKQYEYVKKVAANIGQTAYRLGLSWGNYQEVEISFDSKTFLVTTIKLYSREESNEENSKTKGQKQRIEISYFNINTAPVFGEGTFSETTYIAPKGKTFQAVEKYKAYHIINLKLNN